MFYINSIIFVKDKKETVSYVKEDNFVGIVRSSASEEDLLAFLYSILDELNVKKDLSLEDFDRVVSEAISKFNLPLTLDLSLGFLKNDLFFIKTIGEGFVFGVRGKEKGKIIQGNKSAVGRVKFGDWFIFGFGELDSDLIVSPIGNSFEETSKNIQLLEEKFVALYANVDSLKEDFSKDSFKLSKPKISFLKIRFISNKKFVQAIVGLIILSVLIFSVYSGYEKKQKEKVVNMVTETKKNIEKKLKEAEEIAFLSPEKAEKLFNEAKEDVSRLKIQIPEKYLEETKPLDNLLSEKEKSIFKEFNKNVEEFFDLSLLYPNAKALLFKLFQDQFLILTSDKKVYSLGIENKRQSELIAVENAKFIDGYEDGVIVFDGNKIVFITEETKKDLVEKDEKWIQVVDFASYGKNIYLLDSSANQIFKHTPIESGFSSAISYLEGEFDFSSKAKFVIDGNIYVVDGNNVYKFFKGKKQDFVVEIPVSNYNFDFVFTSSELDYLYLGDKSNSKIYVVLKESGELFEQVSNPIIKQALDMAVYKGKIYLLTDTRIYMLN